MTARSDSTIAITYALCGTAVLVLNRGCNNFSTLVLGLGALVLAAAQAWLVVRKVGPDKTRHQMLMGPFYALLAISWSYKGFTQDNGHYIGFGICFIIIAALYLIRAVETLRDHPAND